MFNLVNTSYQSNAYSNITLSNNFQTENVTNFKYRILPSTMTELWNKK